MTRNFRNRLRIVVVLFLALFGVLLSAHMVLFHLNWMIALSAWGENNRFEFTGQVIDVYGKPVANVEVEAVVTYANVLAMTSGNTIKREYITIKSDTQGMFAINVSAKSISIIDVRKEGYRWIWELDGFETHEPSARNTSYSLSSWKPDPTNLPLYPLQPIGETLRALPSRGGFDKTANGGWRKNVPTEPRMSSLDHPDEVKRRGQYRNRQDE